MTLLLDRQLTELRQRLAILPDPEEPPPTTLQILGRSRQERDWQSLLFYFLDPDQAHGLGQAMLEQLLTALSERTDIDYNHSRFDLEAIQVQQEVKTDRGRPDAVVWCANDWFILWELKVDASEGEDQTPRYVDIESFHNIDLDAGEVDDAAYIFLAPGGTNSSGVVSPAAAEFVHVSWEWVAAELQSFLAQDYGAYPARTTVQIEDFIDTIQTELTMTDYQENQQEKVELYVEHYDDIAEVEDAFGESWTAFTKNWGRRLVETLDGAERVDDETIPDEYVSLRLEVPDGEPQAWVFRQGHPDWSWMFRQGWWTKLDEDRRIYDTPKPNARVGFLHRLEHHRDDALGDNELVFYLRNAPSGHDDFYQGFAERFNADEDIPDLLPAKTRRPGRKSNVLEARYAIDVDSYSDFFEAYLAALARALDDHVLSNLDLVAKIDRVYTETVEDGNW